VYKVQRLNDNKLYALKKVKMNQLTTKEKENALNEVRILASIDSPAIIAYKEAFFDQNINVLCVVMEFAGNAVLMQTEATSITTSPTSADARCSSPSSRSGWLPKTCSSHSTPSTPAASCTAI
jgi:serine/threonine protein kinase